MSGFDENDYHKPGTTSSYRHLGDPLTAAQIRELPDGAEIMVTWDGGNGPWPYRVLVDFEGQRRAENLYPDLLLEHDAPWDGKLQAMPLHRVTAGWDEDARAWAQSRRPAPEHIRAKWATLRGGTG